jgi:hypothetical protein
MGKHQPCCSYDTSGKVAVVALLAYSTAVSITDVKSFIIQAPAVKYYITFFH